MTAVASQLPNETRLLRGCRLVEIRQSGEVKHHVFMPRFNGKDRNGLSVSIEDAEYKELHEKKFTSPNHGACSLVIRDVREVVPLDVVSKPKEEDPTHALIVGFPDRTLNAQNLADAENLARQLAKRARLYIFE